ncbi:MAG: polysaccharide biosynthesis C-terminal domain-containing protein, partial [Lachnospiraceae bacterium]|nr:polysaccharide biosynthesis C-terminal domain-containing protein [Lachnospiraceae bacterium]
NTAKDGKSGIKPMLAGLSITLPLSLICTFILFKFSGFAANELLGDARTAPMIRILSFSVPFAAIHACINGYFYGRKRASVPAGTQLIEQLTRVLCVYAVVAKYTASGISPSINVAAIGLAVGEFVSMAAAVLAMYIFYSGELKKLSAPDIHAASLTRGYSCGHRILKENSFVYTELLGMAMPLTANRIVLNLLQSIESVSIPQSLRSYGYDTTTALSVYGVLTGMAMPFIFFPNAITSSISVLLLPMVSENQAYGDMKAIKKAAFRTVKYCFILGFIFMSCFFIFGDYAGIMVFDSPLAGYFIRTLGFLCPFLYLDSTLSSILQGLGMAGRIFIMNLLSLIIRMGFVFLAVPVFGIKGYLWGMLASQIILCIMLLICLERYLKKNT